jgi:hypothetical protein
MPKKSVNWPAMKAEFMSWEGSLDAFRKHKGIVNAGNFYQKARKFRFAEDRQEIANKSLIKVQKHHIAKYAAHWKKQFKLWEKVEDAADNILTRKQDKIEADELSLLSNAIEKALKSQKLILGEKTGDETGNVNIHLAIANFVEAQKNEHKPPKVYDTGQALEDAEPLQNQD